MVPKNQPSYSLLLLVRKQHIDESLRVEYTTAGDDEVWIPPGKKTKNFFFWKKYFLLAPRILDTGGPRYMRSFNSEFFVYAIKNNTIEPIL